jgi:hypothetical protein
MQRKILAAVLFLPLLAAFILSADSASGASAGKLQWQCNSGCDNGVAAFSGTVLSGTMPTAETSMSQQAAYEVWMAIFGNAYYGGQYGWKVNHPTPTWTGSSWESGSLVCESYGFRLRLDGTWDGGYCHCRGWGGGCYVSYGTWTVLVDNVPPTVTVTAIPSSVLTNWQTDATADVSCIDNEGNDFLPSGCNPSSYRLAAYSSNPGSCPATYSDYTLSTPQAITSHSWVCAAAMDMEENKGFSSPAEFFVDKSLPSGTISINSGAAFATSQAVTLSLTYSDTGGSGIKDCRYTNDGILDTEPWEACIPTKSWTLTSGQGLRTVHYQVRDNAGNTHETSDHIVVNSICNSASSWFYCCVRGSCQPGEADTFHMYDTQNSSAEILPQNSYPYKMCCMVPGASTDCEKLPHGTLFKLQGITNSLIEKSMYSHYDYDVCLHSSAGDIHCEYSTSQCSELGDKYLCIATMSAETNAKVSDCDGVNDYSIKVCCEFKDLTPPVTSITPDGTIYSNGTSYWTSQNVQFSLSCSDEGGSCSTRIYYKIIDDVQDCGTGFSPGATDYVTCEPGSACTKKVCYYSVDDSGNQETVKNSSIFRIDKKLPETSDSSDDNWHGSDVDITLACNDPDSECKDTYYCVYSEGGTPCTPTTPGNSVIISCPSGVCRKIIRYNSTDNAGNAEPVKNSKYTIKIDKSLPSCTLTTKGGYRNSTYFNISWTASGASITSVTIQKKESGDWTGLETYGQATGTNNFTGGQNGLTYAFRCKVINAVGNQSYSSEITAMVDTKPPSASIQAQPYTNNLSFPVSWPGSDSESGIASYTVRYKAGASEYFVWDTDSQSTSATFGPDVPLTPETNTTYRLKVTATDKAGNTRDSSEIQVMVDTGEPSCTIQDMTALQQQNDFTVRWSGSDGESGIKELILEQRIGSSWVKIYNGTDTSKEITDAQDGIYRFRCRATDKANNLGELSDEKNTTVDMNPPEAQINFSSAVYVNDNLNVNAVITDAIKVSTVTLYYSSNVVPYFSESQSPNYSVWNVAWTITNLVSTGLKNFTIRVQDVNGHARNYTSQFLVALCAPGEIQSGCKCGTGTKTCRTDGNWGECTNVTKKPRPEVCNGEDDDCNGFVDDVSGGTSIQSTKCQCYNSDLLSASAETCDGIDNNCNGQIDEGGNCCNNTDTQPCGSDAGICKNRKKTCSGGLWGPCEWEQGPNPGGEVCGNNLDDDCNGEVDDQCIPCTDADGDGYGSVSSNQCSYTGQDCDDADPNVNPGAPEICDGKDNNCNGETDEGLDCNACSNGILDGNEEAVDCGGDCPACFVWGWLFLTAGGVATLLILLYVWLHMKRQGRKLTWGELKKKWTA